MKPFIKDRSVNVVTEVQGDGTNRRLNRSELNTKRKYNNRKATVCRKIYFQELTNLVMQPDGRIKREPYAKYKHNLYEWKTVNGKRVAVKVIKSVYTPVRKFIKNLYPSKMQIESMKIHFAKTSLKDNFTTEYLKDADGNNVRGSQIRVIRNSNLVKPVRLVKTSTKLKTWKHPIKNSK